MQHDTRPDVLFIAESLRDLANLNYRQMTDEPGVFRKCIDRLVNKEYKWVVEPVDTWRDAMSMATGPVECDCEDLAALIAAIIQILFGNARVGIRKTGVRLCHAIAGDDVSAIDVCPIFGMPGVSYPPTIWFTLTGERRSDMFQSLGTLIVSGIEDLVKASRVNDEEIVTSGIDDDGDNIFNEIEAIETQGLDLIESLLPVIGADAADKLRKQKAQLEKRHKALQDDFKKTKKDLANTKADLDKKRKELDAKSKECAAAKKRLESSLAAAKSDARSAQTARSAEVAKRKVAEQRAIKLDQAKATAEAVIQELRKQIDIVEKRGGNVAPAMIANIRDARALLSTPDALDAMAYQFVDDPASVFDAFEMAGVAKKYIEDTSCCAACAIGEACEGECPSNEEVSQGNHAPDVPSVIDQYEILGDSYDDVPIVLTASGCTTCRV